MQFQPQPTTQTCLTILRKSLHRDRISTSTPLRINPYNIHQQDHDAHIRPLYVVRHAWYGTIYQELLENSPGGGNCVGGDERKEADMYKEATAVRRITANTWGMDFHLIQHGFELAFTDGTTNAPRGSYISHRIICFGRGRVAGRELFHSGNGVGMRCGNLKFRTKNGREFEAGTRWKRDRYGFPVDRWSHSHGFIRTFQVGCWQ